MAFHSMSNESLSLDELVRMAHFHFSVLEPLIKEYVSWALDNLSKETGKPQSQKALSPTEKIRLTRAFYRFQLCCHLFGALPGDGRYDHRFRLGPYEYPEDLSL